MSKPLVDARGIVVTYSSGGIAGFGRKQVQVLHGVDLAIDRGEVVGIVGESGSGKTTLGRTLLGLVKPAAGQVLFHGVDIAGLAPGELRHLRKHMQMIFQDPMSSLNARQTIRQILVGPILLHGVEIDRKAAERRIAGVLDRVRLPVTILNRYPHELSGGQRQRIGIARAIVLEPDFVLADEVVSGLDVSTQAQVLDLLSELRRDLNLSFAFISHDLSVVRAFCTKIAVLRAGKIVEAGKCESLEGCRNLRRSCLCRPTYCDQTVSKMHRLARIALRRRDYLVHRNPSRARTRPDSQ
jgi:ABC-type glutathione transport system ATPase component